jgi:predicted nucleic acid-binding protein
MSEFYFDSSALVKLYVAETGSEWVNTAVQAEEQARVWIAKIGIVEAASAIARHHRTGNITSPKRDLLFQALLFDSRNRLALISESNKIIALAVNITQKHPLRGYDAVHLAAALELNKQLSENQLSSIIFVSADENLNQAAFAEGLTVENPSEW